MKILPGVILAVMIRATAYGDGIGITSVEIDGAEYTNISDVHVSGNKGIFISAANGMMVISPDKLPDDFLKSWNINKESAAAAAKTTELDKSEKQEAVKIQALNQAIASGCFREVDGVVYDIRNPESGWVRLTAQVLQIMKTGAIVDATPNGDAPSPAHVRNLPDTIGDTDTIDAMVKPVANFSYVNKLGDDRTIRGYDFGRICSLDEIPESVLRGEKAFDVMVQSGASAKDVLASLPENESLRGNGSGFFITGDGYFITNFHVVKDARKVKVKNGDAVYPASVVQVDEDSDLALLKVSGEFKPIGISTNDAELGESVFTIGFPDILLQGTAPKFTDGKISSLAGIRDDPKNYQISVPIQPGNSGGPLVDMNGNVVGVIVAKLNDVAALSTSGDLPQNVNYAIKGEYLNHFLKQFPQIKANSTKQIPSNGVVQSSQQSVAMVLVY
jgi:S1-C subfamily serine protease